MRGYNGFMIPVAALFIAGLILAVFGRYLFLLAAFVVMLAIFGLSDLIGDLSWSLARFTGRWSIAWAGQAAALHVTMAGARVADLCKRLCQDKA